MRNLDNKLKDKKVNYKKLLEYGFKKEDERRSEEQTSELQSQFRI